MVSAVEQVMASATSQAQRKTRQLARESVLKAVDQAAPLVLARRALEAESLVAAQLKASQLGEADINTLAYALLGQPQKVQFAAMLMKFNVETFPESANAYDSYGEALLEMKQAKLAKAQFQRALALGRSQGKDARALAGYEANLKKAEQAD